MLRESLQGTRRESWIEKTLTSSPCPYFHHHEPCPHSGKEIASLEVGHEDRGSPTLLLDLAPVASSGVDSGVRSAWFGFLWSQGVCVAAECGLWRWPPSLIQGLSCLACSIARNWLPTIHCMIRMSFFIYSSAHVVPLLVKVLVTQVVSDSLWPPGL